MLEILFTFIPLIFLCSAIGLIIINFEAIAAYILYVLSMMLQPHDLIRATSNGLPEQQAQEEIQKKKFNFATPFIRVGNLIRILFFPNLDISEIMNKKPKYAVEALESTYLAKTQEEVAKYRIKTYSAPSNDNTVFKYSYEPNASPKVSSTLKQMFPSISELASKASKIDFHTPQTPPPYTQDNNQISEFGSTTRVELGAISSNTTTSLPQSSNITQKKIKEALTESLPDTSQDDSSSQEPPPVVPPPEPPSLPPLNTPLEIPKPDQVVAAKDNNEEFDAIAALEAKLKNLKSERIAQPTNQINKSFGPNTEQPIMSTNDSIIPHLKIDPSTLTVPTPTPIQPIVPTKVASERIQSFGHEQIVSFNFAGIMGKMLLYGLLSLPIIILIISILIFLSQNNFEISKLIKYPEWVSQSLENFVKTAIVPAVNNNK